MLIHYFSFRCFRFLSVAALVPFIAPVALAGAGPAAAEADKPSSYYKNSREGWYWYLEEQSKEERNKDASVPENPPSENFQAENSEKAEPVSPPEPFTPEPSRPRSAQDYSLQELWTLHPDEFKPVMENTLNFALQSPTEANVLAFKQIETIARLRAARFASVAAVVGLKHPEVSTLRDAPSSNPGIRARRAMENDEISSVIASARSDFALLYFASPSCPFCREQDSILDYFVVKHAWQVKRIDPAVSPAIARELKVSTTPTLLLIHKGTSEPMPVGVGVTALPVLERNIFRAVRLLRGEIGPEDFQLYDYRSGGGFDPSTLGATGPVNPSPVYPPVYPPVAYPPVYPKEP